MGLREDRVKIIPAVQEEILQHAREESPRECCGLLSGEREIITRLHRMRNILRSEVRYAMDPTDLFHFFKELRYCGYRHLRIYHSHPMSEAYPSATDIEQAFYPNCSYFIASLNCNCLPSLRAFTITGQAVMEQMIGIVTG